MSTPPSTNAEAGTAQQSVDNANFNEKIIHPEKSTAVDSKQNHTNEFADRSAKKGLDPNDIEKKSGGSSFSLLDNEDEERLLGDAGPLPPSESIAQKNASISQKAGTAPCLRSVSLPQGPECATSPELGRAFSVTSINGAPCSLAHPPADKKSMKVVSEYYKKQNDLLESFKADNEQIQVFQKTRTRQRLLSTNSQDTRDGEGETLMAPLAQHTDGEEDVSVKVESMKKNESIVLADAEIERASEKDDLLERHADALHADKKASKAARRLATITLCVNVILMISKAIASYISGSMSIVSSLIDSVVDITSGLLIFLTSRAIRKRDPYTYPRGRTRLEPISLICISVIMGFASVQVLVEAVKKIVSHDIEVTMGYPSAFIMVATIVVKGFLVVICKKYPNDASIQVLAQDHRNDCISNTVALVCAAFTPLPHLDPPRTFFNTPGWEYLDPIGAIIVCLYIIVTWFRTGKEHVMMLAGKSANPEFINRIIKVCIDHDPRIEHIDTVYVYHYGMKFLVEVHIVLDEDMPLKVAHDISESLQINIESLPDVERAFVHTDYEYEHQPQDEHKVV